MREWMTVYDIQGILTVSYSNDKALRGVSNPLVYHMWHLSLTWDFPYITCKHTKNHQSHVITNLLGIQFQGACLFDPFLEPFGSNSPIQCHGPYSLLHGTCKSSAIWAFHWSTGVGYDGLVPIPLHFCCHCLHNGGARYRHTSGFLAALGDSLKL